jgi:hypothetical protein
MAQLTQKEFDDLVARLVDHLSLARLHERLLKANALVSRKRPANAQALAAQLYQLSAGLRRDHPSRYAVEVLWQDMLANRVTEEHGKTLETLAERVNTCLTERLEVIPDKSADLLTALGAYHQAVASLTDEEVAYLEMLLRATASVAQFLRERRSEIVAAGITATEGVGTEVKEEKNHPDD